MGPTTRACRSARPSRWWPACAPAITRSSTCALPTRGTAWSSSATGWWPTRLSPPSSTRICATRGRAARPRLPGRAARPYNRAMPLRLSPAAFVRVALLLPVLLLLGRLSLFVTHSAEMVTFPWQIDFDEGVILHSSWLLEQGHTPYPPPGADHFISSVYPPLFYALNTIALKLAGLNLWSGRALSLLGTLL